ncbi:MAG: ubiquinol-cytochrome C chaperone family protein [Sphingomicrobium sp.]|nr:ubiquinol-cytochrome C chaperone [Sphingomonadales bacterium]
MRSLLARLRPASPLSSATYDAAVNVARAPHWYRAGAVPDSMDGRFAVLATVLALVTLRIEEGGQASNHAAVTLTEAFIADMDAQMRQAGFGDPSLGKQVRHLVGSLASRVDRWRRVLAGEEGWIEATRRSLYRDAPVAEDALAHSVDQLRLLHQRLAATNPAAVEAGRWS